MRIHKLAAPTDSDIQLVSKAMMKSARIMGITNNVLALILGLSESQVSRIDHGKAVLDGKSYELGLLLIRLFRGLSGIVGADDKSAMSWLLGNNIALRGKPIELIQTVSGLVHVVSYVDSRRAPI